MQEKESKTNIHYRLSLFKSIVRILGGLTLIFLTNDYPILIFGILFVFSEVFGILEEIL